MLPVVTIKVSPRAALVDVTTPACEAPNWRASHPGLATAAKPQNLPGLLTANDAGLAEGMSVLMRARLGSTASQWSASTSAWRHTRRGDKYMTRRNGPVRDP